MKHERAFVESKHSDGGFTSSEGEVGFNWHSSLSKITKRGSLSILTLVEGIFIVQIRSLRRQGRDCSRIIWRDSRERVEHWLVYLSIEASEVVYIALVFFRDVDEIFLELIEASEWVWIVSFILWPPISTGSVVWISFENVGRAVSEEGRSLRH